MNIAKAIDEQYGGYSINELTGSNNEQSQSGGFSNDLLSDLYIPLGLYFENDRAEFSFHKQQKAGTVDDKLFEYLFEAVSKTRSKPTRKEVPKPLHKTRKGY